MCYIRDFVKIRFVFIEVRFAGIFNNSINKSIKKNIYIKQKLMHAYIGAKPIQGLSEPTC